MTGLFRSNKVDFLNHYGELLTNNFNAQSALQGTKLPNTKNEAWKYTNLTSFIDDSFSFHNEDESQSSLNLDGNFDHIVFENGIPARADIKVEEAINFDMESSLETDFLYNFSKASDKKYTLILENNSKPVCITHLLSGEKSLHCYELAIKVKGDKKIHLLEEYKGESSLFSSVNTLVNVPSNSHLDHTMIHHSNTESMFGNTILAEVAKDGSYQNNSFFFGNKLTRSNIHINLKEVGATGKLFGLYNISGNSHHDSYSVIKHSCERTYSEQLYKGLLDENSRGVFTGNVYVAKDAQKIESSQLNKNLLLSKKAKVNSRPQLEIYADDVKCAHGSTTAQLSEDELFYFMARCIDQKRAKEMLAEAYVNEVILKINSKIIQQKVRGHLKND